MPHQAAENMAQEFGGVAGPVAVGGHPHENTAAPEEGHYEEYAAEEPALHDALQRQLEYYFSRDNLAQDAFLVSQMDHDLYVPIATIASFKMVRSMTTDLDLIVHVLRQSSLVQVDETNYKVRPVASLKRNTLILRELPAGTTEEEVWGLFDVADKGDTVPRPTSVRCDIGNMWFIGFETEEDTRSAFDHTHNMVFKGTSIKARIKSESLLRATSYPSKNGFKKGNSYSGPPMMVPVHDMPPEMHVFGPMAAPYPQHMDPMGYGGMPTDMYGAIPPAPMFYPGMQWVPHHHYEQARMIAPPVPVFKPVQMHPGVMNNESFPPLPTTQSAPEMKSDTKPTVAVGKVNTESIAAPSTGASKGGWGDRSKLADIVKVNLQGAPSADMVPRTTKPTKPVVVSSSKEKDSKKNAAQHNPQRTQGSKPATHPSSPQRPTPHPSSKEDHHTPSTEPAPTDIAGEGQGGRSYAQMLRRQNSSPTKDVHGATKHDTHAPSVATGEAQTEDGGDGIWEQARRK